MVGQLLYEVLPATNNAGALAASLREADAPNLRSAVELPPGSHEFFWATYSELKRGHPYSWGRCQNGPYFRIWDYCNLPLECALPLWVLALFFLVRGASKYGHFLCT